MENAVVLLKVDQNRIDAIADRISRLPGVDQVHAVAGIYDLVALIKATTAEGVDNLVNRHMAKISGVHEAHTLAAERTFTRRDVDPLYSGGLGP
ncbi:Lrp/AsnC family transcriptional regulator [Thiohalomonas denitrificans]|uniref:Transcriptional regulator, AsnC family n=1 Tax=Thiohalomonas denitrificans TaxID=415747 RepID=A0A1G5QIM7_9GAMM|nr:Lrp/AsnC ligand binding domain-containing protein [Thiohalomonas denitrificans]SCZ61597.1 transcriptional regulator, AsnC family [Thiohalomonas denitrificans]